MTELDTSDWRYPPDKARDLIIEGMCPICGRAGWKSPLNHVARKHGIDRRTMRDACDLTLTESVLDPELAERFAENGKQRDMTQVNGPGRPRAKQQWTRRGRATNNAIIAATNQSPDAPEWRRKATDHASAPDARARQGESLMARWASLSPAERAAKSAHLKRSTEQLSEQATAAWDKRGRQPCGTRAAYRRGCRCQACRAAYLAHKRAEGRRPLPAAVTRTGD